MARQLLAAVMLFAVMAPWVSAQERQGQGQGQAQGPVQDPNGPTQAMSAVTTLPPPDKPSFLAKAKQWADDHQLMERLTGDVDGWYPKLGGMTRGGGFAFGPGYRTHVGDVLVDLSMGISTKTYKAVDVKVRWLQAFDERVEFWTNYRYEDFPQQDFFGRGESSLKDHRVSYDFDSNEISALGLFKPASWLEVGSEIAYMRPDIGEGSDPNYPSIEQLFADVEAAGLIEQPSFLHTTIFADIDYRDERGRPRSGGFYHVAMGFWNDRTLERYDFKRFDATLSQFVPLDAGKKHVVMGRVGLSYANSQTGSRVPFYFLPYVGGVDTIRAFHEFRFQDENALWMNAEYNWVLMKWVSVATFIDAGKVAPDWQDMRLSALKHGYGFGVRVHSNHETFARVDVGGGGGEGWRVFLKLGPSF
jgi:outer membrane protein assembly factor BamA